MRGGSGRNLRDGRSLYSAHLAASTLRLQLLDLLQRQPRHLGNHRRGHLLIQQVKGDRPSLFNPPFVKPLGAAL
jgi:hypothetical protein